jgi:hypothetical protein
LGTDFETHDDVRAVVLANLKHLQSGNDSTKKGDLAPTRDAAEGFRMSPLFQPNDGMALIPELNTSLFIFIDQLEYYFLGDGVNARASVEHDLLGGQPDTDSCEVLNTRMVWLRILPNIIRHLVQSSDMPDLRLLPT